MRDNETRFDQHEDGNPSQEVYNLRLNYLKSIGLTFDPFEAGVAELEMNHVVPISPVRDGETLSLNHPTFLAYLTTPPVPKSLNEPLLIALRRPEPTFIFSPPGGGKTSSRLALEARCRREPDGTLVVRFTPSRDIPPQSNHDIWTVTGNLLARDLAIDLFIQIMEQFPTEDKWPSEKQLILLAEQIKQGGRNLEKLVRWLLQDSQDGIPSTNLFGLAEHWIRVNRFAIQQVNPSAKRKVWLEKALVVAQTLSIPTADGKTAWENGLIAAKAWGFNRVLLLIDEIDTSRRNPIDLMALVTPFLRAQPIFSQQDVHLKVFLPEDLRKPIEQYLSHMQLSPSPLLLSLTWDMNALRRLLHNRFRAAHSRRDGLNDLAADDFPQALDDLLLEMASGSPRRLLNLIHELITVHLELNPSNPLSPIYYDEFKMAISRLGLTDIDPLGSSPSGSFYRRNKHQQKQIAHHYQRLSSSRHT